MKVFINSKVSSGYSWQLCIPSDGLENLLRINFITILCGTHDAIQLFPAGWDSQSIRARIGDTICLKGEFTTQQIEDLKEKIMPNLVNITASVNYTDICNKIKVVEVEKDALQFDPEEFTKLVAVVK